MAPEQTASQAPIALDKFPDMALPALYSAAIGAVNTAYYLQLFTRFEAAGRAGLSWNWAAGLCTFNWLLFRKLTLPAVIYLVTAVVVPLLLLGLGRLVLHWDTCVEWSVLVALAAVLFGVPALIGNGLLYTQCRRDIERAIAAAPTLDGACQALAQQASTRTRLLRLAGANAVLLVLAAVLVGIFLPAPPEPTDDDAPADMKPFASAPVAAVAPVAEVAQPATLPASVPAPNPEPLPVPAPSGVLPAASAPTPVAAAPVVPVVKTAVAGHYVNVGLFADPDNGRRAYVKLFKAELPARRDVLLRRGQKLTRVRAGPFASRAEANAAIVQIKKLQLDAALAKP